MLRNNNRYAIFALGAAVACTFAVPAIAAEPSVATTKISDVVVYADRAQVTRVGSVDLGASGGEIAVEGLPGWIDHESVRVTLSKGTILDVAPTTTHLAKAAEASVRKADEAVQALNDKMRVINDDREVIRAEVKQLRALRAFTTDKLPRDVAHRRVKPSEIAESLDFIANRMKAAAKANRDLDASYRELLPELNKANKERNELRTKSQLKQTRIVIAVKGSGKAKLTVVYMTPGTAWEPGAELRVHNNSKATLVQHASVVNTTGEDWTSAKLSFSTQRPGEMLQVPAAKALLLGTGGKAVGEVVGPVGQNQAKSFGRASSAYMQMNMASNRSVFKANLQVQQAAQRRAQAAFAKLSKRGTTAHFVATTQRSVRSNGKPVRVPITEGAFAVTTKIVAVPEVSLNAVRTAQLTNSTTQPILPGPVALFVNGAFLGKSNLNFVAPGESFSAFLGVVDGIKLTRSIDRKRSSIERGRKRTEVKASFIIQVSNLTGKAITLHMSDRVPVPQGDDMEIDDVVIPKGAKRDSNGLVRWAATIRPKAVARFRIEYELEYPNALAAKAKKSRSKRMEQKRRAPASRSRKQYNFDAIDEIEQKL